MQIEVIWDKEEFQEEIDKVRVWKLLSCEVVRGAASLRAKENQEMPLLCHWIFVLSGAGAHNTGITDGEVTSI